MSISMLSSVASYAPWSNFQMLGIFEVFFGLLRIIPAHRSAFRARKVPMTRTESLSDDKSALYWILGFEGISPVEI